MQNQKELSEINEAAWNQLAYDAWINRFGSPEEAAAKIKANPTARISSLYKYLAPIEGKKIINLLGSNGNKSVALALLGAEATVVDIASENGRYAKDLARAAGVPLKFIVSDVLELPAEELVPEYDIVLIELGILHYFVDLNPFAAVIAKLLKKGGKLVLQDFHPISTKLITSKGKKHKVTGDYFDCSLEETEVAYMKFVPGVEHLTAEEKNSFNKSLHRKWTLGEIVTAIGNQGLCIKLLEEEEGPKPEDKGIPKLFTIVAEKL